MLARFSPPRPSPRLISRLLYPLCIWLTLVPVLLLAQPASRVLPSADGRQISFEAFVRSDLPAAKQVADYAEQLRARVPGLNIKVHDVLKDREQLKRLYGLTEEFGRTKVVVPAFYTCNRMYFGFADAASSGPKIEQLLTADVYTRDTCPRCRSAKAFIAQLKKRWPAVQFRIHEITRDVEARRQWEAIARFQGKPPGLPTISFARHIIIGYQGDSITGRQLEQLIERVSGAEDQGPPQPADSDSTWLHRPSRGVMPWAVVPSLWPTIIVAQVEPRLEAPPATAESSGVAEESDLLRDPATPSDSSASAEQPVAEAELPFELELPGAADASDLGEAAAEETVETSLEDGDRIRVPFLGEISVSELGLPLFTFLVGIIDGFNPCAMWILVFLLSVLVNIKDRRKILAVAGTFVVVSGLAYFAFMAAWLNLFMLIGIARPVQIVLACFAMFIGVVNIKDFFAFKKGISLSIPESSKPGLYRRVRNIVNAKYLSVAIAGAITLAVVVNLIELLCTAGLPALYTQILTMQGFPAWKNYLYLALYISAYMLDDTLLLTIVIVTLSHRKLQEREGQWLKLLSGVVILLLGMVMLLRPEWLQIGH